MRFIHCIFQPTFFQVPYVIIPEVIDQKVPVSKSPSAVCWGDADMWTGIHITWQGSWWHTGALEALRRGLGLQISNLLQTWWHTNHRILFSYTFGAQNLKSVSLGQNQGVRPLFRGSRGGFISCSSSFWRGQHSLTYGHITPVSASVVTILPPLLPQNSLCFSLIEMPVIVFRAPLDDPPLKILNPITALAV